MRVVAVPTGPWEENTYIVWREGEKKCLLIDPGSDAGAIEKELAACGCAPKLICLTHFHADHTLSAPYFRDKYDCPILISAFDAEKLTDRAVNAYDLLGMDAFLPWPGEFRPSYYGTQVRMGSLVFFVIPTPGHSRGGVSLYEEEEGVLFTGDTLFRAGFGRTDLYGASSLDMRRSLRQLFALPRDTVVYPGHGDSTSIGEEKERYGL